MRRVIELGLWCGLGASAMGCFDTQAETPGFDEAQAVAEALTRKVDFENGLLLEGFLPDSTAPEVQLLPLEAELLMSPGDTSLMALELDNPGEAEDPVEATLVQFGDAAKDHVEVRRLQKDEPVEGGLPRVENRFRVKDDICDSLCNKRFSVKVFEVAKTRSGKVGRHRERALVLDCSELGDASRCPNGDQDDPISKPMTGGDSGTIVGRDGGVVNRGPDAGAAFDAGAAGAGGGDLDAGPIDDLPDASDSMPPKDGGTAGAGGAAGSGSGGSGGAAGGPPDAAVELDGGST